MEAPKEDLDLLILAFLEERLPFADFQPRYSYRYIDEHADENFSSEEIDYYSTIHERAEWTSAAPSAEDRSYGWTDPDQFRSWLKGYVKRTRDVPG